MDPAESTLLLGQSFTATELARLRPVENTPAEVSPSPPAKKRGRASGREASKQKKPKLAELKQARQTSRRSRREPVSDESLEEPVCLSSTDKAEQIRIDNSGLTATGDKGYRMVRATHGVQEGEWYFEMTFKETDYRPKFTIGSTKYYFEDFITQPKVGWTTGKGDLQAPVGYDRYSFSYRDVGGTKFHESIGRPYGEPFAIGDVIGCYIYLPNDAEVAEILESGDKKDVRRPKILKQRPLPGSKIVFYKNGVSQGVAFTDLPRDTYYPAVSLYMGARVSFNFGPKYQYPPPEVAARSDHVAKLEQEAQERLAAEQAAQAALTALAQQSEANATVKMEQVEMTMKSESAIDAAAPPLLPSLSPFTQPAGMTIPLLSPSRSSDTMRTGSHPSSSQVPGDAGTLASSSVAPILTSPSSASSAISPSPSSTASVSSSSSASSSSVPSLLTPRGVPHNVIPAFFVHPPKFKRRAPKRVEEQD